MKNYKYIDLVNECEKELEPIFKKYEKNELLCSAKVFDAFHKFNLSSTHFAEVTGYGYYDSGRDVLEKVYADIFKAEDALVRPQILSGSHALSLTLFGLLKYGDTFISITGEPYDSLQSIIGLKGDSENSLIKNGINYEQIDLDGDEFNTAKIIERLKKGNVKLVEIQRSRGYSHRKSLEISKIEKVCSAIKQVAPNVIIMVDNCYGDFTESREPIEVGADVLCGSLMKNLGGGIAKSGGYIVGRKDLIWSISERYSVPCVGKDVGANYNQNQLLFKGMYMAPSVVCSALKTATLISMVLQKLGFEVSPKFDETRTDIVQSVNLYDEKKMLDFCQAFQYGTVVDSFAMPIPSSTPGYPHEEIMASGSFNTGSTIEFSCDGPVTTPYSVFMQGSLTYGYGKLGVLEFLERIKL